MKVRYDPEVDILRILFSNAPIIAAAAHKKACLLHLDSDFRQVSSIADVEQEQL